RFERRISPQQTNRFCFQSIIGGLCFEPPHRALNSKVVLDKSDIAKEMGVFAFRPDLVVLALHKWTGLLRNLQSATIYATQVASLNDADEIQYGTDLYKQAVTALISEKATDPVAVKFLEGFWSS
ncbi:MAG: hypothetical protein M3Y57_03300, partial [Acidobacteriota bacterium]|nr:hypothetical protein [Acidobacteriota bacterium]